MTERHINAYSAAAMGGCASRPVGEGSGLHGAHTPPCVAPPAAHTNQADMELLSQLRATVVQLEASLRELKQAHAKQEEQLQGDKNVLRAASTENMEPKTRAEEPMSLPGQATSIEATPHPWGKLPPVRGDVAAPHSPKEQPVVTKLERQVSDLTRRLASAESCLATLKEQAEAQRAAEEFARQLRKLEQVGINPAELGGGGGGHHHHSSHHARGSRGTSGASTAVALSFDDLPEGIDKLPQGRYPRPAHGHALSAGSAVGATTLNTPPPPPPLPQQPGPALRSVRSKRRVAAGPTGSGAVTAPSVSETAALPTTDHEAAVLPKAGARVRPTSVSAAAPAAQPTKLLSSNTPDALVSVGMFILLAALCHCHRNNCRMWVKAVGRQSQSQVHAPVHAGQGGIWEAVWAGSCCCGPTGGTNQHLPVVITSRPAAVVTIAVCVQRLGRGVSWGHDACRSGRHQHWQPATACRWWWWLH